MTSDTLGVHHVILHSLSHMHHLSLIARGPLTARKRNVGESRRTKCCTGTVPMLPTCMSVDGFQSGS